MNKKLEKKLNIEIEELELKQNKKIILIDISGNEIKLKKIVNIFTNTFTELCDIIYEEIEIVNIMNIIVNEHVYVCLESYYEPLDKDYKSLYDNPYEINERYNNKSISELLDIDYDKDYIDVTIVYSSYFHYIKYNIHEYVRDIYYYYYCSNLSRQEILINKKDDNYSIKYENNIKKDSIKKFIYNLSKIDNICICIDEYKILESLIKNKIFEHNGVIHISSQGSILLNKIFLLNEIKKYLIIN